MPGIPGAPDPTGEMMVVDARRLELAREGERKRTVADHGDPGAAASSTRYRIQAPSASTSQAPTTAAAMSVKLTEVSSAAVASTAAPTPMTGATSARMIRAAKQAQRER